jgi:hypothetical protein
MNFWICKSCTAQTEFGKSSCWNCGVSENQEKTVSAKTEVQPESEPLADDSRRPLSIWLLLLALGSVSVTLALQAAKIVSALLSGDLEFPKGLGVLVVFVLPLLIGLLTCHAVYRRKPWGRWLGVLFLLAAVGWQSIGSADSGATNEAQREGFRLGKLSGSFLTLWWAYLIAFSKKVSRYFHK